MGIHIMTPLYLKVIAPGPKYGPPVTKDFYPHLNVSEDGYLYREGNNLEWADVRDGAGTNVDFTSSYMNVGIMMGDGVSRFNRLMRIFLCFDTLLLPPGALLISATIKAYAFAGFNMHSIPLSFGLYSSAPANPALFVNEDYNLCGTTLLSDTIPYGSITFPEWKTFTLNAAGLAQIKTADISQFSLRDALYDAPNSAPPWQSNDWELTQWSTKEGTLSPVLTIIYQPLA